MTLPFSSFKLFLRDLLIIYGAFFMPEILLELQNYHHLTSTRDLAQASKSYVQLVIDI